jgi:exopolyphosphatase/guanosine-5'-triphosphate,3'-diphosphate pyrophosphatase
MDVGTNSTRLLIADVDGGRILAQHARDMVVTRLGKGVDRTGRLDPDALRRTLDTIGRYADACARHGVEALRIAATSATRDAANRREFLDGARERTGVEPEVLTGAQEAAASFLGATWDLVGAAGAGGARARALVFDIGGGSTEFILGVLGVTEGAGRPPAALSVDIGSVRLTERHVRSDPPTAAEVAAVRADAERELVRVAGVLGADTEPVGQVPAGRVVGVAGTVTTVTAIALGLTAYDPARVHRTTLSAEQIRQTAARLCAMTVADKAAMPVMPPGREDVIAAGALILDQICRVFEFPGILVSETDILDGLVLGLARRLRA